MICVTHNLPKEWVFAFNCLIPKQTSKEVAKRANDEKFERCGECMLNKDSQLLDRHVNIRQSKQLPAIIKI